MLFKNCVHRRGNVCVGRLHFAHARRGLRRTLAQIGGQLLDIRQFGGAQGAQGVFDFSDRHAAKLAHAPHPSNPQFIGRTSYAAVSRINSVSISRTACKVLA